MYSELGEEYCFGKICHGLQLGEILKEPSAEAIIVSFIKLYNSQT